jgi:hypothetical protein
MIPSPFRARHRRMARALLPFARLVVLVTLGMTAGCEDLALLSPKPAAAPPAPARKLTKTTKEVLDLKAALDAGAVPATAAAGEAGLGLETIVGAGQSATSRVGILQVEHKMKLYQAERGKLPATHAEFMTGIMAPGTADELTLPALPSYQAYAFDPEAKGLVIVEFPDRRQ